MTALPTARAASPSDLSPSGSSQSGIANAWSADSSDVGIMDGHICYVSIDDGAQEIARVRLDREGGLNAARLMAGAPGLLVAANEAFDFLGGVDGAAEIRSVLLTAILAAAQPKEINP